MHACAPTANRGQGCQFGLPRPAPRDAANRGATWQRCRSSQRWNPKSSDGTDAVRRTCTRKTGRILAGGAGFPGASNLEHTGWNNRWRTHECRFRHAFTRQKSGSFGGVFPQELGLTQATAEDAVAPRKRADPRLISKSIFCEPSSLFEGPVWSTPAKSRENEAAAAFGAFLASFTITSWA